MPDPRPDRKRVLVTGVNGFTGAPLKAELERAGYAVVGTAFPRAAANEVLLDIADAASCEAVVREHAPHFAIHLAGISFVQHADALDFYRANTIGTINLLDALANAPTTVEKVLLPSSANVYGHIGGSLIGESQPIAPTNHYAASKVAMEMMAATFNDRLPIVVTRPFNYTGPGQSTSFLVPKIVSHFARGERAIELGNLDVERDFSDVRAVATAYRRLIESNARSRVFNICTGVATSLRQVIGLMEDVAGYRIEVRVNPALVRTNDIVRLTGDPRALVEAIGPLDAPPFRDTLERMFRESGGSHRSPA